jgi:hypothetical protein
MRCIGVLFKCLGFNYMALSINPDAVIEFRPKPALIRIKATQKKVVGRTCANGWSLVDGSFVHRKHAKLIKVLEEA